MKRFYLFTLTVLGVVLAAVLILFAVVLSADGNLVVNDRPEDPKQETLTLQEKIDAVNARWGVPPLSEQGKPVYGR